MAVGCIWCEGGMGKWEGSVRTSEPDIIARYPLAVGIVRLGSRYLDKGHLGHPTCASCTRGQVRENGNVIAPCGAEGKAHRRRAKPNCPEKCKSAAILRKMREAPNFPPFDHADTRPGLRFELLMCLHPADYSHGPAFTTQPLLVHVKIFSWRCSTKNGPFFGHFLPFI